MSNLNLLESKSPFETFPFFALFFIPLFLFFFKESIKPTRRIISKKVGRNEPCPCGSGKKYKLCHGI